MTGFVKAISSGMSPNMQGVGNPNHLSPAITKLAPDLIGSVSMAGNRHEKYLLQRLFLDLPPVSRKGTTCMRTGDVDCQPLTCLVWTFAVLLSPIGED